MNKSWLVRQNIFHKPLFLFSIDPNCERPFPIIDYAEIHLAFFNDRPGFNYVIFQFNFPFQLVGEAAHRTFPDLSRRCEAYLTIFLFVVRVEQVGFSFPLVIDTDQFGIIRHLDRKPNPSVVVGRGQIEPLPIVPNFPLDPIFADIPRSF